MDADWIKRHLSHRVELLILTTKHGEFADILQQSTAVLTAVANISSLISSSGLCTESVILQCIVQIVENGAITIDHVAHLQVNAIPGNISEDALAQLRQILTNIFPALTPSVYTVPEMNFALMAECRQELLAHLGFIERLINHMQELLKYFHDAFTVCQVTNNFIVAEYTKVSERLVDVLDILESKGSSVSVSNPYLTTFFAVLNMPLQTCLIALRLLFLLPLLKAKFETVFKTCMHAVEIYVFASNILSTLIFLFSRNVNESVKDDVIKSIHAAQETCNLICSLGFQASTADNTTDNPSYSCESKIYQLDVTQEVQSVSDFISKKFELSCDGTESTVKERSLSQPVVQSSAVEQCASKLNCMGVVPIHLNSMNINQEHNYAIPNMPLASDSTCRSAETKKEDGEQETQYAFTSNCKDDVTICFESIHTQHSYATPEIQCSLEMQKKSSTVKPADTKDKIKKKTKKKDQVVGIRNLFSDNARNNKNGAITNMKDEELETQCAYGLKILDNLTVYAESSDMEAPQPVVSPEIHFDLNLTSIKSLPPINDTEIYTKDEERSPPKSRPRNTPNNLLKHISEVELLSLNEANKNLLVSLMTRMKFSISQFSFSVSESKLFVLCKICGLSLKGEHVEKHVGFAFHKHNLAMHGEDLSETCTLIPGAVESNWKFVDWNEETEVFTCKLCSVLLSNSINKWEHHFNSFLHLEKLNDSTNQLKHSPNLTRHFETQRQFRSVMKQKSYSRFCPFQHTKKHKKVWFGA